MVGSGRGGLSLQACAHLIKHDSQWWYSQYLTAWSGYPSWIFHFSQYIVDLQLVLIKELTLPEKDDEIQLVPSVVVESH